jgi:hypothetical protein
MNTCLKTADHLAMLPWDRSSTQPAVMNSAQGSRISVLHFFFVLESGGLETSDTLSMEFSKFSDKICAKENAQNINEL